MLFNTPLSKRLHNNRQIHAQHYLNEHFKGFNTKKCSNTNLHMMRTLLHQGINGVQDKVITPASKNESALDAVTYLTDAEKQIFNVLLNSFTLKHATNHLDYINTDDGKMKSLHQREALGETVWNRRTPSDVCNHYSLFFAMGIGQHQSSTSLLDAKDIVVVDLMRMSQDDPLTLSRCWVSGHASEYQLERTYAIKIGNAKYVISHHKNGNKLYDITYDNGVRLQWSRHFNEEVFSGADIAPGIALQLIYLFRMLGGSQNPCIAQLYNTKNKNECFEWLEKIMPCLMPGTVYPEAKIISELNLDANYITIEKNIDHSWSGQIMAQHQALVSSIKADNLVVFRGILNRGYLANAINQHQLLYLAAFQAIYRMDIFKLLIKHGISAPGDEIILLAVELLRVNELDYLLAQEYRFLDEPLIKSIPNPNPRFNSAAGFLDAIDFLCNHDFSADKLRLLYKYNADFHTHEALYFKRASKTLDGRINHKALDFLNEVGIFLEDNENLQATPTPHFKQKVATILTGTKRDGRRFVLLGRPRASETDAKNYYCFPGGSADKTDSNLEAAAIRELFEETSINVNQIPTARIQLIGEFGDFNKTHHESTSIFLIDIGSTIHTPYACDDLIEVKCVPLDKLTIHRDKPLAQFMTFDGKIILGSNALLIEALLINQQQRPNPDQFKMIHQMLHIEAKGYLLFANQMTKLKKNELPTDYWHSLELLIANMPYPSNELLVNKILTVLYQTCHSTSFKLALKYWPDLPTGLISSLFKSHVDIKSRLQLYIYSITLAISTNASNSTHSTDKYHRMFRSIFPQVLDPFSTNDMKKAIFMALASGRLKMSADTFGSEHNIDVNFSNYGTFPFSHAWDDVIEIMSFLNHYKDIGHAVRKFTGLNIDSFSHHINTYGVPTIRFRSSNILIIKQLKARINGNCSIYKTDSDEGTFFYVICGQHRLLKLGFNANIADYLLTYCRNSPFLITMPMISRSLIQPLMKNELVTLKGTDLTITNHKLFNDYFTHVIQESNNLKQLFLKSGMRYWQLKILFEMTQNHNTIDTLVVNGSNFQELKTNSVPLDFIGWLNSFPSLDKIVLYNIQRDDLVLLIQKLSESTPDSILTVKISDSPYLITNYEFIAQFISDYHIHHELLFDDAPPEQQHRINDKLIINQWAWIEKKEPLFIKNISQEDILNSSFTTIDEVKKKLYYHWMLQNSMKHTHLNITGLINNNIGHVLCSLLAQSTTLKSVTFDTIKCPERMQQLLHELTQSLSDIHYLEFSNMTVDTCLLANVLRKHSIKQLNLSTTVAINSDEDNNFADAIAYHPYLEVLIADETDICLLFFKKIVESRSLLFVSYPTKYVPDFYIEEIQARCEKNSTSLLSSTTLNGFFNQKSNLTQNVARQEAQRIAGLSTK